MRGKKSLKKHSILIGILSVLVLFSYLAGPQKAKAVAWYEHLISDSEFSNKNSMSVNQIQNFLMAKGSGLANYIIPQGHRPPQPGAGQRASNYIWQVAQEFRVNPKVILVTMQKEESLITLSNPSSVRLEWAMGYGYYPGSPYTDPNNPDYLGGFGRQVYYATRSMRYNFDRGRGPGSCRVGQYCQITTKSWESGKTNVYLSNRATALLYRYTPYIYNGNYNFYTIYRNWFGPGSDSWTFLLIRAIGDPKVYLVDRGKKVYIPYVETLTGWGFSDSDITDLSASAVASYPRRSKDLTLLVRGTGSPRVYYMDSGVKRYIPTAEMLVLIKETIAPYGTGISDLAKELVNAIKAGSDLAPFVKNSSGSYWLISGRSKYPISTQMMSHWGLSASNACQISDTVLNKFSNRLSIGNLVRPSGHSSVWSIQSGRRKWIPDPATLYAAFRGKGVRVIPLAIVKILPRSSNVTALVKGSGSEVFYTGDGTKRWIPDPYTFKLFGFSFANVKRVPNYILGVVRTGTPKFYLAKGSSRTIYWLYGGVKRAIPDPHTFFDWGFRSGEVRRVSNNWLRSKPTGPGLRGLVKSKSSAPVYYLESKRKRWIPSPERFGQLGFCWLDLVTVDQYLINYYSTGPDM